MSDVTTLFGPARYPSVAPLSPMADAIMKERTDHEMTLNEQLRGFQKDVNREIKQEKDKDPQRIVVDFIRDQLKSARSFKEASGMQEEMVSSLMQYNDMYNEKEARLLGGKDTAIWFPITSRLCDTMIAFFRQVLSDDVDHPLYDLEPTTVPEPPEYIMEAAREAVAMEVQQLVGQGQKVTPDFIRRIAEELGNILKEEALDRARESVRRAKDEVDDALERSNWAEAFDGVLKDVVVLGTTIMEGPTPTVELRQYFEENELKVRYEKGENFRTLDPLRYFPSQDSTTPNNGSFQIYVDRMSQKDLQTATSCDGFLADRIELLLTRRAAEACRQDSGSNVQSITDKSYVSNKARGWAMDTMVEVTRYYGCAPGKMLLSLGLQRFEGMKVKPEQVYEVVLFEAEGLIIFADCNRDPLNLRPFHKAVLYDKPGSFWGTSAPKRIRDIQRMINAYFRSAARNAGFSSAPIFLLDHALIDQKIAGVINNIKPGMIIDQNSLDQRLSGQALQAIEMNSRAAEFINAMASLIEQAELGLGLPRFLMGGPAAGGAARTARGLAQLQSNAAVNIRSTIVNIDLGIIRPAIKMLHRLIVTTTDDPAIAGDVEVVTLGATSLLARETNKDKLLAGLGALQPFFASGHITNDGILLFLRDIVSDLGFDPRKMVADPARDAREALLMVDALGAQGGINGGIATGALSSAAQGFNSAIAPNDAGFNQLPNAPGGGVGQPLALAA